MKKIFGFLAVALMLAISFSSCNNKPGFVKLAEMVDSINARIKAEHNIDVDLIEYDQWENKLTFEYPYEAVIDPDAFEPIASNIKENFIHYLVVDDEDGLAEEIVKTNANVVIDIEGLNDTSYEVLIESNEIAEAIEKASTLEPAVAEPEPVDTLSQAEIEHELLEGNIPSIEKEISERQ